MTRLKRYKKIFLKLCLLEISHSFFAGVSHLLHRERISDFAASDHAVTRK
ncbi:Uncharacterized protein dnm_053980 [Desulfonema magnum]|uniref:Uncharacterized protein n=1 Tax=Desulfonema magnum TaxID=45655 RepID=A0A975BPN8_9BACT|nr:Uncharacterized protein dnm_053980 [Desulfonema magnum]